MRSLLFGFCLLGSIAWARSVGAQEAVEGVRVEVRGAPECSDRERFFDEVRWRTARVRRDEAGRTFDVEVKRQREKYEAPNPNPAPMKSEAVAADRDSRWWRPGVSPAWRSFAGAHASIASAGDIDALGSGRIQIGLRYYGSSSAGGPSLSGPEFRIGAARSLANDLEAGRGTARVQWTMVSFQVCSLHLSLGARLELGTCANGDWGQMSGEAAGVQAARDDTRTWVAVGGRERLGWNFFGPIVAELEIGADVPVTRDEFVLDPNVSIYRPPVWMPIATFGVGARFR